MTREPSEPDITGRDVATSAWRLSVPPGVTLDSPLVVIPTVHPRGDRRVTLCTQVALNAGFRVHLIWLGEGTPCNKDSAISETLFPPPQNTKERVRTVANIAKHAAAIGGDLWHIHDFYFLREARRWQKKTGRKVLYDQHEYYGLYYSEKLPLPGPFRRLVARGIDNYQARTAKRLGGANVVTEQMSELYRSAATPVTVSPNYPSLRLYRGLPSVPFHERRWKVLHVGTLTPGYGTQLLLDLATRAHERALQFEFEVVGRFPSADHARNFERVLKDAGSPSNLRVIPSRPAHEMPDLFSRAGFGLSLLVSGGQFEIAVPSKIYEQIMAGLVNVVTDRNAQRAFVEEHGVGVSGHGDEIDVILDRMQKIATEAEDYDELLAREAQAARDKFTWEMAVEPRLRAMLRNLGSPADDHLSPSGSGGCEG